MALALKEWHVVSEAIARGDQVITVRKGGIHEKAFGVEGGAFWLFPNWEHQTAAEVKPAWHGELARSDAERPAPGIVPIRARCEVVRTWELDARADGPAAERLLAALDRFHLWTTATLIERLVWRPTKPLVVLLVRASALPDPVLIERTEAHGGCRSWVEVPDDLPVDALLPSLTDDAFARWAAAVTAAIDGAGLAVGEAAAR